MLLFRKHEVNGPAAANVWTWPTKVIEDSSVTTAYLLKRVGKYAKACRIEFARRQNSLLVGGYGELGHGRREPSGLVANWAEGIEDVPQKVALAIILRLRKAGTVLCFPVDSLMCVPAA
jgi:hypothetical protein